VDTSQVIKYYETSLFDYRLIWLNERTLGMHYGYWDEKVKNHDESLLRYNQVVADQLRLTRIDLVLDAGCGLGGTAFWVAANIGCHVTGISITPDQIKKAKEYANKKGLAGKVHFEVADFRSTTFADNYFDAVYAIETICHLVDKGPFFTEMYRVLKPGGRLLVSEYTLFKDSLSSEEDKRMKKWLSGWFIPNLWRREEYLSAMKNAGFVSLASNDFSDRTHKSAKRLYWFSLFGIPTAKILTFLRIIDPIHVNDGISCFYQWITKKRGLWGHVFYYGEKA